MLSNNAIVKLNFSSGIEGDLMACVAMCPAVREKLGPALLHTYCSVDIVEGLDVDKEEFDKFSARCVLSSLSKRIDILVKFRLTVLGLTGMLTEGV